MKKAKAWRENIYFIECPYCHNTANCGEYFVPEVFICEECNEEYEAEL